MLVHCAAHELRLGYGGEQMRRLGSMMDTLDSALATTGPPRIWCQDVGASTARMFRSMREFAVPNTVLAMVLNECVRLVVGCAAR